MISYKTWPRVAVSSSAIQSKTWFAGRMWRKTLLRDRHRRSLIEYVRVNTAKNRGRLMRKDSKKYLNCCRPSSANCLRRKLENPPSSEAASKNETKVEGAWWWQEAELLRLSSKKLSRRSRWRRWRRWVSTIRAHSGIKQECPVLEALTKSDPS